MYLKEKRKEKGDVSQPRGTFSPGEEGATAKPFDCASSNSEDDGDCCSPNKETRSGEDNAIGMSLLNAVTSSYNNSLQPPEVAEDGKGEELSHAEWLKKDINEREAILMDGSNYSKRGKRFRKAKNVLDVSEVRIFINDWKNTCRAYSIQEVSLVRTLVAFFFLFLFNFMNHQPSPKSLLCR